MPSIHRAIWPFAFLAGVNLLIGCALPLGTRTVDVTNDPHFQGGYREGEAYRLKTDACLMEGQPGTPDRMRVLWSQSVAAKVADAGNPSSNSWRQLAIIPAGSTIRITRLRYSYFNYFPPLPPGGSVILCAYGTVTTPSAQWQDVVAPNGPELVAGSHDGVDVFLPDAELLEKLPANPEK